MHKQNESRKRKFHSRSLKWRGVPKSVHYQKTIIPGKTANTDNMDLQRGNQETTDNPAAVQLVCFDRVRGLSHLPSLFLLFSRLGSANTEIR